MSQNHNILAEQPVAYMRIIPEYLRNALRKILDDEGRSEYNLEEILICSEPGTSDRMSKKVTALLYASLGVLIKEEKFPKHPKHKKRTSILLGFQTIETSGIDIKLVYLPVDTEIGSQTLFEGAILLLRRKDFSDKEYQQAKGMLWEEVN